MALEPAPGQADHGIQSACFFEQMGGAGDDLQLSQTLQPLKSRLIERQYVRIVAADDQQCGSADLGQILAGEIGPATSADDGVYVAAAGRRDQGSGSPCAGAKKPQRQRPPSRRAAHPVRCLAEPIGEQRNVEHVGSLVRLVVCQQVK